MAYTVFSIFHACCIYGRRFTALKESAIVFLAASSSAFRPLMTSFVISCPQKHTVHLSSACGSLRTSFELSTKLGCSLKVLVNDTFTLRSGSSNPQRQPGVHGDSTTPPTQPRVEPMI